MVASSTPAEHTGAATDPTVGAFLRRDGSDGRLRVKRGAGEDETMRRVGDLRHYDVIDRSGQRIGRVEAAWSEYAGRRPEFLGVRTRRWLGHTHMIPGHEARVDHVNRLVHVPYDGERVRSAPRVDPDHPLMPEDERDASAHFGVTFTDRMTDMPQPGAGPGDASLPRGTQVPWDRSTARRVPEVRDPAEESDRAPRRPWRP